MKKFSIVMGYYNRRSQFLKTLRTIYASSVPRTDYEIIVVDDGSDAVHDISDVLGITLVRIPKDRKTWVNPVVAYNLGITYATGEWIILQNPEVTHDDDFMTFLNTRGDPNVYYCTQVFAEQHGWYSHPEHRPVFYHFCSAIHSSKLSLVGGFNTDMKDGIDYDDNEILERIKRVCKLEYAPIRGTHQWHASFAYQRPNVNMLRIRNMHIFERTKQTPDFIFCDPHKVKDFVILNE
jgi:glycosyltransferase involved in cell wall biosynthesis